jgi:hypothetical protein
MGKELEACDAAVAVLIFGGSILSGKRWGPGRALTLAGRSRFWDSGPAVPSARTSSIAQRQRLRLRRKREQYIVVGPARKGLGKTCLIKTALAKTCGVVSVNIHPVQPRNI